MEDRLCFMGCYALAVLVDGFGYVYVGHPLFLCVLVFVLVFVVAFAFEQIPAQDCRVIGPFILLKKNTQPTGSRSTTPR
jgi:hypothetical protein